MYKPIAITAEVRQEILDQWAIGVSAVAIAKTLAISEQIVYRTLEEKRDREEMSRAFAGEVNWREWSEASLRMLCLNSPSDHAIQKVILKGRRWYTLACGCQRRIPEPQTIYTRHPAKRTEPVKDDL